MIQTSSVDELLTSQSTEPLDFTLKGLLVGHIGMLIAAPHVGKSHLAMCLAIEHSSSCRLLGMSQSKEPKRTLIINTEDSPGIVKSRLKDKLSALPQSVRKELNENLHFLSDLPPIVIPPESNAEIKKQHTNFLKELVETLKGFDLVIIDTVTESIGECCEVRHDRLIKNTFQNLAKESNCSILLVHHVNKDEIRGAQKVTMASGAGLTSIMRLTKCLFTINARESKSIVFLKSNYLEDNESQDIPFEVKHHICVNQNVYKPTVVKARKLKSTVLSSEPKSITLRGIVEQENDIKDKKSLRDVL